MRRIRWAPAAADDPQSISDYLQKHHPAFRQKTIRRLYDAIHSLKKFPLLGRTGTKADTRELVMAPLPYIIVYASEADIVHIFASFTLQKIGPSKQFV